MNGIHRLLKWWIFGILFIAVAGLLLLFKARKSQANQTCPDTTLSEEKEGGKLQRIPVAGADSKLARVLQELFARTGFDQEETRDQLAHMGVLTADPKETSPSVCGVRRDAGRSWVRRDFGREIEKAIQVGLKWARSEDDYNRAGAEYSPGKEGQTFEAILFNSEARDRLDLCSKLLINLQEMFRGNEFPQARKQMEELIAILNDQAVRAEEELTYRTIVHESEVGTLADRQYCEFQAGVIQHLRSKGLFPELDALYRAGKTASALNHNDREAFALLIRRSEIFAAIEQMGIQKLLQADEGEIRAMIVKALPPLSETGSTS